MDASQPSSGNNPPCWFGSQAVVWLGGMLAIGVLVLAGSFIAYELAEVREREVQMSETLARVIEDHVDRSLAAVDLTLVTLEDSVSSSLKAGLDPIRLGPLLAQAQHGMPLLRSLSVLDSQGRVLASTNPDNVDQLLDTRHLLLPPPGQRDLLGRLLAGRDLVQAAGRSSLPPDRRHHLLPLVRRVDGPTPGDVYLAAALNVDHFGNEVPPMLGDPERAAALFSTTGQLLASTEGIRQAPGSHLGAHPFLRRYLPARERGAEVGRGIDQGMVVTAFRTLRNRPLAVLVERPYASVRAELASTFGLIGGLSLGALLVISALSTMAWRSLRGHERVRRHLAHTQAQVARSEHTLRDLVENVQELIFRTDAQGRINFVNGRWRELSAVPPEQALGHRLDELCDPTDGPAVRALFGPVPHASGRAEMLHLRGPGGEVRTLELSVAAVQAPAGAPPSFVGFAVDVTERQAARQDLQTQLTFAARLIEISPTPLFVKDTQGRFVTVNRAWLDLMSLSPQAVLGHSSAELFGDAPGPFHRRHDLLLSSQDQTRYESRLLRGDGEQRDTVVTKLRFRHADGRPAGIIGSIVDVTEFREAERLTREARDAAERTNRAKSEFLANITHELRTPLQSIIGFSEMGQTMACEHPELEEMFQDIHAGGQRMLRLVNSLLDTAKVESSIGALQLQRSDLAGLAAEVAHELSPIAAQHRLQIVLPEPLPQVWAQVDSFRIQQVVRNLLANAMRFAPAGSSIVLDLQDMGEDGIDLTVRDHGPGFPPDELDTVFEAFVQSSRTRHGGGGTGLGLTISRKIMQAHGGHIVAANAPGGGALLRIHLPAPDRGRLSNWSMGEELDIQTGW